MRTKNLKLKISYLLIGLLGYLFIAQTAIATPLGLSIDPSIIEINAIPPTVATSSLMIQNKGDTQVTLQIHLKPFRSKGENARPPATSSKQTNVRQGDVAGEVGRGELEYITEPLKILKNIQILDANVPVESITLSPKQQKTLILNIDLSKETNISPADYYFSIIFLSQNTSIPVSNSSLNQIGIVTNVLLSVGPAEIPKAAIEEFSSNLFFEKGPVPFTVRVKNTGDHFIRPMGEIIIKNMFGQNIGKLDLTSVNVLSDSIRTIPTALWKESFLLGFYTATLNISMSDEGPAFSKTSRFFAFPFQVLIIIVIITIVIIVVRNRLKLL